MAQKNKKKTKATKIRILEISACIVLATLIIIFILGYLYLANRVYPTCEVEAGSPVEAADFVRFGFDRKKAAFAYGTSHYDVHVPGEYPITIQFGDRKYETSLIVTDTTAPTFTVREITTLYGVEVSAEELVADSSDATEITYSYLTPPDFQTVGLIETVVVGTDLGGNSTNVNAHIQVLGIYPEVNIEAGDPIPSVSDIAFAQEDAVLKTDLASAINMEVPGDYEVIFDVGGVEYSSVIRVSDSIPPTASGIHIDGFVGYEIEPIDFLTNISDSSALEASFVTPVDFNTPGDYDVEILLRDAGGNETTVSSSLSLVIDDEAPVITGTHDISILCNEAISYKTGVTVTDNADANIALEIEHSEVDTTTEGTYSVIYRATDHVGNSTEIEIHVTVVYRPYTEEDVYAMADVILEQILSDGMTDREKAEAIFNWVDWNIYYTGHTEKISWIQGAYDGFNDRQGDCYTIACAAKALYTRAGLENVMIHRYPVVRSQHYWNLVKIEGKWYHFDSLTREDGARFFMWTSAQLEEYDRVVPGYHSYDHTLYPESE